MKKSMVIVVVALFACVAVSGWAESNQVNVTGNIVKDGKLMVDVDWQIDSAKYPGMSREAMRDMVRQDIKKDVVQKVNKAIQNSGITVDSSNFTVVKETTEVIQTRPNGTKLFDIDMLIEFAAQPAPVAASPKKTAPKYEDALNQRWDNDI